MKTPGPYEAIVLADSIADGVRLTTLCVTFPRIVLAEFNTHRVFSRNSASSRAIPVRKRIAQIRENPYVPLSFGKNKRGMQAKDEEVVDADDARVMWRTAAEGACVYAESLAGVGLHKQWANRLVEPFAWHTCIVSATEWENYFALRISEHAQPEICKVSEAMKVAMDESVPEPAKADDWHLPLIDPETVDSLMEWADPTLAELATTFDSMLIKLSVARCAAVSYNRHMEQDVEKELARYEKLLAMGHMSPFEHAAVVAKRCESKFIGNFRAPWIQHRKTLQGEAVYVGGGS